MGDSGGFSCGLDRRGTGGQHDQATWVVARREKHDHEGGRWKGSPLSRAYQARVSQKEIKSIETMGDAPRRKV